MTDRQGGEPPLRTPVLRPEDYLLLAATLLLPWAFGGVALWGYRTAALLLVAAGAVVLVRDGVAGLGLDRRARWLLPAALLGAWAGLQLVPLPPPVIAALSPTAESLYRQTFPGYGGAPAGDPVAALEEHALSKVPEVADLPEPPRPAPSFKRELGGRWSGWRPLSLSPNVGVERLTWFVALLSGFLVARRRFADTEVADVYKSCFAILFLALGLFGAVYAATANGKLYWIFRSAQNLTPAGPYVNPNHFAGVMELGTPWLVGWAGLRLLHFRRGHSGPPTSLLIAAAVLCPLAGLVVGSRSFAVLGPVSVMLLLVVAAGTPKRRLIVVAGAVVAAAAVGFLLQSRFWTPRTVAEGESLAGVSLEASRQMSWQSGAAMFADFPVTGAGFGSVADVVPRYRPAGARTRLEQLHNDYLEVLVEGGVIAGVLLLWLIVGWARRAFRLGGFRDGERLDLEGVGLLLGLAALAIHAVWSFNLQIHANALLFVIMAAFAVARGERT